MSDIPPEITTVNSNENEQSSVESNAMGSSNADSRNSGPETQAPVASAKSKPQKPRHKWKYALQAQVENEAKTELIMTFPFLNDDNDQDYLFSKYLLANAPYKKDYSNKGSAWTGFCKFMATVVDRKGTYPFLHMAESTAKARFKKYVELSKTWSDKNGDRPSAFLDDTAFPDWVEFENSTYDFAAKDDGLKYALKIRNHIIEMCEECISMDLENERISKEAQEREASELAGVSLLKQRAIGRIKGMEAMQVLITSDDDEIANAKMSPDAEVADAKITPDARAGRKARSSQKSFASSKKTSPPDDTGMNSFLVKYEAARKEKEDSKKALREAREKRKLDELMVKRMQAESEKERNDAHNNLLNQLMSTQSMLMNQLLNVKKDEEPKQV